MVRCDNLSCSGQAPPHLLAVSQYTPTMKTVQLDSNFSELFQSIDTIGVDHCLVLTPNKRLSRYIHSRYSEHQATDTEARNAWQSLHCYSLQGWLQQQWSEVVMLGQHERSASMPLNNLQESLIWQEIIENHPDTPPLLALPATVKLVQSAWRLKHEWHLDLFPYHDKNTQLFLNWCRHFESHCYEQQLISAVELPHCISEAMEHQQLALPQQVFLYGFSEFSPQLKTLFSALQRRSVQLNTLTLQSRCQQQTRYQFNDSQSEIEAAALWAKQQLNHDKNQRIAIVVPNLAQEQARIERLFNRVFEPQYNLPGTPQHAPGFNLSAAQPLNQVPLIHTALMALELHRNLINVESASLLLRSPFIGSKEELPKRALADLAIRGHEFELSLKQLKLAVGQSPAKNTTPETSGDEQRLCSDFYQRLAQFENDSDAYAKQTRYPSQWLPYFCQQLKTLGWPGNRDLDTFEYQQLQAWQEALQAFAALDHICGRVALPAALSHFNKVIADTTFKAQTKDSPIQILGILEAAGLPFDAIWFMNLDDETWPPAPAPNPLLPVALQVERGLPQSNPGRELAYAKQITQDLIAAGKQIIFSHAAFNDDQQLSPSPLISQLPLQHFSLPREASYADRLYQHQELETSWDSCGPMVQNLSAIRGGSALLKDQAACPFRAFAQHRLHSETIPETTIGLDASERGNLLHQALEIIWRRLKTQQKLLEKDEASLAELILDAIDQAMQAIKNKRFVGERFLAIERRRLYQQIQQWLTLEKQRAPFSVVMNEGKRTVKLGKLPIHIRYDRVDKLDDGSLFVLDYKTGKPNIGDWSDDRPNEPQVPLYSIANQQKVSGAAFGQINADKVALIGIAADPDIAPGLKTSDKITVLENTDNWDTLVEQWRQVLEKLAKEFIAGKADVAPKKPPETCRYCDLAALCRIKEQTASPSLEADHE